MKRMFICLSCLLLITLFSCKKENTPVPQQMIRLIDYDTRQGIAGASVKINKDAFFGPGLFDAPFIAASYQEVKTDAAGHASFNFVEGSYVYMIANGYLQRMLPVQFGKDEQEMLKIAPIDLELVDDHLANGTVISIHISAKPDPQLGVRIGESLFLADTTVAPSGSAMLRFDGAAGKQNGFKISVIGDTGLPIKDTVIWVSPNVSKLQFKY